MALTGLLLAAAFFATPTPAQQVCSAEDRRTYDQLVESLVARRAEIAKMTSPDKQNALDFLDRRISDLRASMAACKPAG